MHSHFGQELKISVWGASHAPEIGITITGIPKGERFMLDEIQTFLNRRKGGQNAYSTKRSEADEPKIRCGVKWEDENTFVTDGGDLTAVFLNSNTRSSDYEEMKYIPRPSHADFTSYMKYGDELDRSGGGIFSGRLTLPVCFAGAICMKMMKERGIDVFAHIYSVGEIKDTPFDLTDPAATKPGKDFPVINAGAGEQMVEMMTAVASEGDSVGGVIECAVTGLPAGVGEPLYDSMEAVISHMMFGIPAVKGIEFGCGFKASEMKGSECNDPFIIRNGEVKTETNNSGGIQGGITNGMPVVFRVAMKPTPSIYKEQKTVNMKEKTETTLSLKGRHDPCIVPRAVPCIEAACAIAVYNLLSIYDHERQPLGNIREQIDTLDTRIAKLISERMDLASKIAKEKKTKNLPVKNPEREEEVLRHVADVAGDRKGEYVRNVYRKLIDETCRLEEEYMEEKNE